VIVGLASRLGLVGTLGELRRDDEPLRSRGPLAGHGFSAMHKAGDDVL